MCRYVDADAFDDTVQTLNEQGWNITRGEYKRMDRVLFEMPTADVIPIEWIKEQKDKCFPDSITEISLKHLLADWERREDEQIH